MEFFQGQPARPGVAIAAAAHLRSEYGVPTLDPQRLRRLGERLRRFGIEAPEPEQVVLIAESLPAGFLAAPLPGIEFVGVAAGMVMGNAAMLPCPCVIGLPGTIFVTLEEDEIVIVDGDRGRVYISPDAPTLARYQTPERRAHRVFIGSAHLPARTISDNRLVAVIARTQTFSDARAAIENGADGLWVPADNNFLGPEQEFQTASEQTEALKTLMGIAGGKPISLGIPTERLALSVLSRAASFGSLSLILEDITLREDLADRFREIEESLEEQDLLFGIVRFEAGLATNEGAAMPNDLDQYTGVWVSESVSAARMAGLLPLAGLAHHAHKPLTLRLPDEHWQTPLAEALDVQAEQVVVAVSTVPDVKDAIRES